MHYVIRARDGSPAGQSAAATTEERAPWRGAGPSELRVRQTTTLLRPDPAAVRDTIHAFAMLFWLAREGKMDTHGRPSPLQGAVIQQSVQRHGASLEGLRVPLQRALVNVLAAWGRRRGYVACNPAALG